MEMEAESVLKRLLAFPRALGPVSRVYIRDLAIEHTAYLIEIGFIRKQYSEEHMVFSIG
jgi:hypothetical protein